MKERQGGESSGQLSQELFAGMEEAIGFLQGVLVHALTPAFHRIPMMYRRLGASFAQTPEVQEILDAMIRILDARRALGILTGPREARVLERLQQLRERMH